ncbi:MAG TPA: adenine phosphoribosyltransferase [Yinghuangia sp.]|uniref:adenine phosphoribosyltransferase n=1 Tax=Yinghuangia sp. YIM S10712 TaxID=3436930 RepID=UPI002C3D2506|nr:adenine phosphoribosyltransferase [Yinghuangia sp.]
MELRDLLESRIRDVPDWPKPGVVFKDISPLLADQQAFGALVEALADQCTAVGVDKVVGIEARGFILAAPVAFRTGAGFVPVRKMGKLPCATYAENYELEYGSATLEVHQDAFVAGDRVLVIDDVLATGGTVGATIELIRRAGARVVGVSVLMELGFLGGRARIEPLLADTAVRSFIEI